MRIGAILVGVLGVATVLVGGFLLLISGGLSDRTPWDPAKLPRVTYGEPKLLRFTEPGSYIVYHEQFRWPPAADGQIKLFMVGTRGQEVELNQYDGDLTYRFDDVLTGTRYGQAIFTVEIPQAGEYRVEATSTVIAAGAKVAFDRSRLSGRLVGFVLFFGGNAVAVAGVALFRRGQRVATDSRQLHERYGPGFVPPA